MGKCSGLQLLVCWLNTKYWMFFFPILYCINSGMFLNLQNHHRNKEHFSFSPSTVSWKKHLTKVQLYKKQEVSFPSVAGLSCITNLKATRLAINIIMLLSKKKYIYIYSWGTLSYSATNKDRSQWCPGIMTMYCIKPFAFPL